MIYVHESPARFFLRMAIKLQFLKWTVNYDPRYEYKLRETSKIFKFPQTMTTICDDNGLLRTEIRHTMHDFNIGTAARQNAMDEDWNKWFKWRDNIDALFEKYDNNECVRQSSNWISICNVEFASTIGYICRLPSNKMTILFPLMIRLPIPLKGRRFHDWNHIQVNSKGSF